ncbi:hypothetical protein FXO38_28192 [Capsicum annuum]|nr:hypothetical protein FXO38_28192 [Capsicum annuum]
MTINNEEGVVNMQNPLDIAQIATEGIRVAMDVYARYQMALAPAHVQMGPLSIPITYPPRWTDLYAPMPSPMSSSLVDLSFYPSYLSPIPWIHSEWNLHYPPPTPPPTPPSSPTSPLSPVSTPSPEPHPQTLSHHRTKNSLPRRKYQRSWHTCER